MKLHQWIVLDLLANKDEQSDGPKSRADRFLMETLLAATSVIAGLLPSHMDLLLHQLQTSLFVLMAAFMSSWAYGGDLDDLQGKWETTFEQNGRSYRAVKTIKNRTETVEVFDGEMLMKRHSVEFDLNDDGEVKTLTYKNGQITFGAGSPAKLPDGKYIYRLEKDIWIGVFGALSKDTGPVYLQTFKRTKTKTPEIE